MKHLISEGHIAMQNQRCEQLRQNIAEVTEFIERDTATLEAQPDRFSVRLSLRSWQEHLADLEAELGREMLQ